MHTEVLPGASGKLLASLKAHGGSELCGWVLAGGTGLALQLGHRVSEDFDFFRTHGMETRSLFDRLREMATCNTLYSDERTLSVLLRILIRGVKLSMLAPFDWAQCKEFFVGAVRALVLPQPN